MITFSEYTREEYARVCADRDEWMARALHYQARHEGLRGLQRAVQEAVRGLEDPYDPLLADIVITQEEHARVRAELAEWMARGARYQTVRRLLGGLQLAVQDAVKELEYLGEPALDDIADSLIAALKASADGGAL